VKIRRFEAADLDTILAIQEQNTTAANWPADEYRRLADDPQGLVLVAEVETAASVKVAGLAAFCRVLDEAELLNLAVAKEQQQRGVGTGLLREGARHLHEMGVQRIFLEVRESNKAAFEFYCRRGFGQHSRRRDYYHNPTEDALILLRELPGED
jgi:ribosomal-protein-alanine N-acetyltransferase